MLNLNVSFKRSVTFSDYIDKLHYYYGGILIVVVSAFLFVYPLVYPPIQCLCPNHFTDNMINYVTSYCLQTHQKWLPPSENDGIPQEEARQVHILDNKYDNLVVALLGLTLALQFPNFLYTAMQIVIPGPSVENMITTAQNAETGGQDKVSKILALILKDKPIFFKFHHSITLIIYKVINFVLVKRALIALGTAADYDYSRLTNFSVVDALIDKPFSTDGGLNVTIIQSTSTFLCDFHLRQMEHIVQYSVQCITWAESLQHPLVMIVVIYLGVLYMLDLLCLVFWVIYLIFSWIIPVSTFSRIQISNQLNGNKYKSLNTEAIKKSFVTALYNLGPDGILFLKFIGAAVGDGMVIEIISNVVKEQNEQMTSDDDEELQKFKKFFTGFRAVDVTKP